MNTKKTYFSNIKTKTETQNSHEPPAYQQSINNSKKRQCIIQDVKTEEISVIKTRS